MTQVLLLALALGVTPASTKAISTQVGTSTTTAADGSLQCRASGDIELTPDRNLYLNGVDVHIGDNGSQDVIVLPSRTLHLKYTAADPQSWSGTPPAYVWDALNRIAAALAASGHKP